MFSRLSSQEPNPVYQQQYQNQQEPQQQHYTHEQPQYQQQPQQQHYPHEQPQYQQQHYPYEQPQYPQQPQYQNQQQQNVPYYQQQPQTQQHQPQEQQSSNHPSGWKPIRPPQAKPGHIFTGAAREATPSVATPIYQQQFQNYHQQHQQVLPISFLFRNV